MTKRKQPGSHSLPVELIRARSGASSFPRGGDKKLVPRLCQFPWGIHDVRAGRFEDLRKLRFFVVSGCRWCPGVLQLLRGEAGRVSLSEEPAAARGKAETAGPSGSLPECAVGG